MPAVAIEGGERKMVTNSRGRAFVTGLGNSISTRIRANIEQIENGYVTSPPANVEFATRPGNVVQIPYPIAPVGEVVARIRLSKGGEAVGLSAVRVRLVLEGLEPIVATTEYDGSAFFERVRPGTYRFELDPEQAANLKMRLKEGSTTISVGADQVVEIEAEVVFEASGS